MEKEIQQLLDIIADLRNKANANACFGEPVVVEDSVVIPVASVGYGFGAGVGQGPNVGEMDEEMKKAELDGDFEHETSGGGGGGGGASASPIAAIEVTSKGVRVEPIVNEQRLALAGALLIGWNVFWLARALIKIFGSRD
jgi:uncharacterized spore protein YtfJ